jgi:hypothetical protein
MARRALMIVLGVALLLPSACLSPTLPLPPPGQPETIEGPDDNGYVRLTGLVAPNSRALAKNPKTSSGVFFDTADDGRYDMSLQALPGDEILLSYVLQGEMSQVLRFAIPLPPPPP